MRFFERKENPVGGLYYEAMPVRTTSLVKPQAFYDEGYLKNPIVYKCVNLISGAISGLAVELWQGDKQIEKSPVLDLLSRPNPMSAGCDFIYSAFIDFLSVGEMSLVKTGESRPLELWRVAPNDVEVLPGKGGMPKAYKVGSGEDGKVFPVNPITGTSDLFFYKLPHPLNYWRGCSPLLPAALSVDSHNSGVRWNYSLLANSARPSGIVEFESDSPSQNTIERMREFFKKTLQGSKNAGEIPMLFGGAKWKAMDNTPKDMDFVETLKMTAQHVAVVYNVPLPLIDNDSSTYNNIEQAKEMLYSDTVIPLFEKFLSVFGAWLLPMFGLQNHALKINKDAIDALEGVRTRKFSRMVEAVREGILSRDEARIEMGYEPIGGLASDLLVEQSRVPLGMLQDSESETVSKMLMSDMLEEKSISDDERRPPEAARSNAARGLELRGKWGRGGTAVGVARARDISRGAALSESTIKRMASFNRHRQNYQPDKKEPDGGPTAGTIAWLLWGGTSGIDWALRMSEKIDAAE